MSSRTCAACDGRIRKGTGRRALVLSSGGVSAGIVCAKCAAGGVLMVSERRVTPALCACKKGVATRCDSCVARLESNVQELSAANVALGAVARAGS